MATKKLKVKAAPKRGLGRPKGSGAKRGRKTKWSKADVEKAGKIVEGIAKALEQTPYVPTATDLIYEVRVHIKGFDSVIANMEAAGVPAQAVASVQACYEALHSQTLMHLSRAP